MMHGNIIIRFGIRNKQESPVQFGQEVLCLLYKNYCENTFSYLCDYDIIIKLNRTYFRFDAGFEEAEKRVKYREKLYDGVNVYAGF